ncbi:unnamed protein product [Pedinophyceae sp. YPF-701]|nr:unnamed protein product [Pedinophyceae sp. YPF-701]
MAFGSGMMLRAVVVATVGMALLLSAVAFSVPSEAKPVVAPPEPVAPTPGVALLAYDVANVLDRAYERFNDVVVPEVGILSWVVFVYGVYVACSLTWFGVDVATRTLVFKDPGGELYAFALLVATLPFFHPGTYDYVPTRAFRSLGCAAIGRALLGCFFDTSRALTSLGRPSGARQRPRGLAGMLACILSDGVDEDEWDWGSRNANDSRSLQSQLRDSSSPRKFTGRAVTWGGAEIVELAADVDDPQ